MSVRQEIEIHPTAVISSDAVIGPGVRIGPYAVIGARVEIGEETGIGPHAVIEGPTSIGKHNRIIGQAAIGTIPQDLNYRGEESFLFIGDGNTIREFVTINRGTEGGGGKTTIGDQNLLILFIFQNSIDQEKGIPMGQKIHDLLDFQAADGFAHSIHFTLQFFFPE